MICVLTRKIFWTELKQKISHNQIWPWSYQQKITENFQEIWPNFLFSGNSYRFSNCVPIKNLWPFFSGICSASCTKKYCQKFFWFLKKKKFGSKFSGFPEKCFPFPAKFADLRIYIDRIKPWSHRPNPEDKINRKPEDWKKEGPKDLRLLCAPTERYVYVLSTKIDRTDFLCAHTKSYWSGLQEC